MQLADLNALDRHAAEAEFLRCCGSRRWARAMTEARPFASAGAMLGTSDRVWSSLAPEDWLEAFRAHPRIGERTDGVPRKGRASWSDQEQSGMHSATGDVRARLAAANRAYEARFGYIFIVCATGKSAGEMLAMLDRRLTNDAESELGTAAEEQRKITRLRLEKLVQ